jgi:hypothetical protein
VLEDGPATETSSPGPNSNGGEVALQPWIYLITTLLRNCADIGESHAPAVNVILLGESLTTVAIIWNLLPDFKCKGEGSISFSSTPLPVVFAVELVSLDWEFAYWYPNPGILKIVKAMIVATAGRIIHCFILLHLHTNGRIERFFGTFQ